MEVLIIGGGLAGLSCARWLYEQGREVLVLEKEQRVGGRVATDEHEGYLLDRGFQVLVTAYPDPAEALDYESLALHAFQPSARIWKEGKLHRLGDPLRSPGDLLPTVFSGLASLGDKMRVMKLRTMLWFYGGGTPHRPTTTNRYLRDFGFSPRFVESFFRPFAGGAFFDRELTTSSRKFETLFANFAVGKASLPARGMRAIPEQLAGRLPPGCVRTGVEALRLGDREVETSSGEILKARAVVLAGASQEHRLHGSPPPRYFGTWCHYYSTACPPIQEPVLVLNGEPSGRVNHLAILSAVAPSYAPPGRALISVTALEEGSVIEQLELWFGTEVYGWEPLKTYHIPEALPHEPRSNIRPVQLSDHLFVCGDHRQTGSIQGALSCGRRAAAAVLDYLVS
ncbi:MAG: FAD-dependent oxidoreductase [Armatimonadetes bacterium]|nr:FAD-dependent oxidoreductase [Armatimonadota bacterium]